MAANINFRIQITSFAAQTAPLSAPKRGSIGGGDSAGRSGGGQQPPPGAEGHRDQLHPTQRGAQHRDAGSDPLARKRQEAYGDRSGERKQHEGGAGDPKDRERRKHAQTYELSLIIIGMLLAIRIALCASRLDRQCLLVSRATPLAAVLQVTAYSC